MDRRSFLKVGTAGALSLRGSGGLGMTFGESANVDALPRRRFGTGPELPVLGFGGAALVARWGSPLSIDERIELVRHAYSQGIRYFDTAGNYLESQRILGAALKDVRTDVFLVTKVETTDPAQVRPAVEKSLRELRTDYLDGVLIHGSPGLDRMTVAQAMRIHAALDQLRTEKVVRTIGFSAHSQFDKALDLIESGGFDHCLLSYGYLIRGATRAASQPMVALHEACLARAHEQSMGIAAMNVLGGGVLGAFARHIVPDLAADGAARLSGAAIRYALADFRVGVLVVGMRFRHEIDANVQAVMRRKDFDQQDCALLERFCARARDNALFKRIWGV